MLESETVLWEMELVPKELSVWQGPTEDHPSYKWVQYKEAQKWLAVHCMWGVADVPTRI